MIRDIVCVPCWRRPELLALALERLAKADGADEALFLFRPDRGHTGGVTRVIAGFPLPRIVTPAVHPYRGNSFNVLEGYREALVLAERHGAALVHLVEEDILVARDYLAFHRAAQEQHGDQAFAATACADQNLQSPHVCAEPDLLHASPRYQSLGVSFRPERLRQVLAHAVPDYYRRPVDYLKRAFPTSRLGADLAEQDGLIDRLLEVSGLALLTPCVPRAYHAGWYGYNRSGQEPPHALFPDRLAFVREVVQDAEAMNRMAGAYKDLAPVPLDTDRRVGILRLA